MASTSEQLATFGLIFGGCCSNALTLELITSQFPPAGSLVTFAQFLLVSLVGLRKQLVVLPKRVPKDEALRHVISELSKINSGSKPVVAALHSPASHAAANFAQELAGLMKLSGVEVVLEDGEGIAPKDNNRDKESPNSIIERRKKSTNDLEIISDTTNISIDFSVPDHPAVSFPHKRQLTLNPLRFRLKTRQIPLTRYAVQVVLFLLISLLNNAAFAYHVPMAVHIIFRSGGLVVNMLMGRIIEKRRYSRLQVVSVLLVTLGIGLTTLSSTQAKPRPTRGVSTTALKAESVSYGTYAMGIAILTFALVLSGFLGLSQDKTFEQYGRGNWEEAMFYLHALSLPLFSFVRSGIVEQINTANAGPKFEIGLSGISPPISSALFPLPYLPVRLPTLKIPSFYIPLLLNVLTQFLCVSGVNRLTSRVNSLTVTLVLVIRKAVSLAVSVLLLGGSRGNGLLWTGATAVLLGTIGYTVGNRRAPKKKGD